MMTIPGILDPMPAALMSFGMDFTDPFGLNAAVRDTVERQAKTCIDIERRQKDMVAKVVAGIVPTPEWTVADMVAAAAGPVRRCPRCGYRR